MVDTVRTLAQLQALLADNETGNISPQDLRDFLVSALGVYGGISIDEGVDIQTPGTSPEKIDQFTANLPAVGLTPDHAQDRITVDAGSDGMYLIAAQVSFSGTNNAGFHVYIYKNGATTGPFAFHRKLGAGGDIGSASILGLVSLVEADFIELWVAAETGTPNFTVEDSQLVMVRIG